ncbi:DEAD/DEAH box helicase [bacterium]|nr:DEAD/DEAH box helicase [bacterium]
MYLSKRGFVLKKELLPVDEITTLKDTLRGVPLQDDTFSYAKSNSTFPIYIETKNKLYIPKMYGMERYGDPKVYLPNYMGQPWNDQITFVGELYGLQQEASLKLTDALIQTGGGILSIGTGLGKTVTTLYTLCKLKRKTLVIVNKIPLMKQWESEISQFLPYARIGFIQGQKNVEIHQKDIVIAMLQSLAKVDYPQELFSDFGTLVVDETHNIASRVFSQVLLKVCCKYTIGLTATPKRGDGCEYVFKWFLGDIVYQSEVKRAGLHPILRTITLSSKNYREIAVTNKFTGKKQIQFTQMLTDLVQMESRNNLIVDVIKDLMVSKPRKLLVLSDRRDHLKAIKKSLDNDDSVQFTYGLFIGQMKIADLEQNKKCDVILASYSAFSEGVSVKELNTLFLVTPKKYIGHLKSTTKNESGKMEQVVGRIFRKEHIDVHPLIVDLFDNFSVYRSQSNQRKVFYASHFKNLVTESKKVDLDTPPYTSEHTISEHTISEHTIGEHTISEHTIGEHTIGEHTIGDTECDTEPERIEFLD